MVVILLPNIWVQQRNVSIIDPGSRPMADNLPADLDDAHFEDHQDFAGATEL